MVTNTEQDQHNQMHRQVAVLVTDLKGSSSFYRTHGNLAGRVMIQKHNALLFPVIEEHGGVVVNTMGDSILAWFEDPSASLDAACEIQKRLSSYNDEAGDDEKLLVRISLNLGDCVVEENNIYGLAVDVAVGLVAFCDAREILVTETFWQAVASRTEITLVPRDLNTIPEILSGIKIYRVVWNGRHQKEEHPEKDGGMAIVPGADTVQDLFKEPYIPPEVVNEKKVVCFYCGTTAHDAARCPSKLIRHSTNFLERLSYLPLREIKGIYSKFIEDYLRPLAYGEEENRYELLFDRDRESAFALGFFSFYEITEIFQLRSLHRLFSTRDSSDQEPFRPSGALMIGRDCLRVTRDEEADAWFQEAIRQNPTDYRPYVDMGIVEMERMDPSKAISFFMKAYTSAQSNRTKRHISLLIARAYEIAGAISRSCEEIRSVLDPAHPWHEGLYYYGVLLAKLGKTTEAINIFKNLFAYSERYYTALLLDPAIDGAARQEVGSVLQNEYEQLCAQARESLASITARFDEIKKYFSSGDPEYQTAEAYYRKALHYARDAGFACLLDIPGVSADMDRLLMRAVEERRTETLKNVARFSMVCERFSRYLEKYPYRWAISEYDVRLCDDFKRLVERAASAADTISLERLHAADGMIKQLGIFEDRVNQLRERLDVQKNLYFVGEFSCRLVVVFSSIVAVAGGFFVLILSTFQVYSKSLDSLSIDMFLHFCRHGLTVGFSFGIVGTALWFARNFKKMMAKLGE